MAHQDEMLDPGLPAAGGPSVGRPAESLPGLTGTSAPAGAASEMTQTRTGASWLWAVLLVGVLLIGAYLRFNGLDWDQNQHLHPDERFLTMVETSLEPVKSLGAYFDTQHSTLNPHNRGYGFYVYGTLPLFIVRYLGEWMGKTGYDQIHLVGRQMSAVMDLGTVLLVYLIALHLFRRGWVALLAAAFAAFSALPIQLSHYFTVETFTNFFGFLAFYFAARLLPNGDPMAEHDSEVNAPAASTVEKSILAAGKHWRTAIPYVFFGIALGMAVASKINAGALAILLPGVALIRWLSLPVDERKRWAAVYVRNMIIAGVVSLLVFRIFQPYAFSGPGFFGMSLNQKWVDNIKDQRAQAAGDVDFPPALQWARRPFVWFAFQNLTVWGLGLPLGILAWAGFVTMGWRMLRGEWRKHALLWGWTAFYFYWQASSWNPTMRYLMLVYPTLAIIAAWAISAAWDKGHPELDYERIINWLRVGAVVIGVAVLATSAAWAYAFMGIYTRPMTRIAASRWIYQNVPGPINLHIETPTGLTNQPLAFRSGEQIFGGQPPLTLAFRPRRAALLTAVTFEHMISMSGGNKLLAVDVSANADGSSPLATARMYEPFEETSGDPRGKSYTILLDQQLMLDPAKTYYLVVSLPNEADSMDLAGAITLEMDDEQAYFRQALPEPVDALRAGTWYLSRFTPVTSGSLSEVTLNHVVDWEGWPDPKTLRLSLVDLESGSTLAQTEISSRFAADEDMRGSAYTFRFEAPVTLDKNLSYAIRLDQVDGPGALAVYGSKQANETTWDDALPVGLDGYNPYDYSQGIYRSDLNFEMYWDDNPDKLQRFLSVLDQADYVFISSNRQWGTTTRVPERYPLTSQYYRELLGCPAEKEITWCYSVAEPGQFTGKLGFELVSVFQSDPSLGSLRFNTQFAEEAFTVYDHPKVLIFKKTSDYQPEQVQAVLGAVDLSTVVHLTPRKASQYIGNLLLPADRLSQQRAGGTWADLFHPDALYNRYPALAAVMWYLVIALLGGVMLPFTRLAFGGLPDRGYPFARLVGMLALAYGVWLLGSLKVPFTSLTVTLVFLALAAGNLALVFPRRRDLLNHLRENWKYYLMVEAVFLGFFLLFLLVRVGNPDLWHPWKGGEKPMDFSYFNAVLKSTSFPPYDPWFAGGYINYYYYGFVIVGVPVKWLGIVPATAYNLILPTLFALLATGAFSLGWNLYTAVQRAAVFGRPRTADGLVIPEFDRPGVGPLMAGLGSALALAVVGNWGTIRMIWHGVQKLGSMQVPFEQAGLLTRITWTFEGLFRLITSPGTRLPYGPGDWYWIPSRAIPGEPITEFPAFTFLYADLHAHMIALPITVLALAWALSILLGKWDWKGWFHFGITFLLGGLAIGALRTTNTWDWPTYLAISCVAVIYTALRYSRKDRISIPGLRDPRIQRLIAALVGVGLLVALSALLYQPFMQWYGQGYNNIDPWQGDHTPIWSYLTHWGAFLFVIVTWLATETIDWMASTPVSSLNKLRRWVWLIQAGVIGFVAVLIALALLKVQVGWLALPVAAWAGILLLRPNLPDAKRAVLFMIGTALVLTLFVEVAVLRGDIGRMNTVFKFYLQAWTLLALSAAASLFWLSTLMVRVWRPNWQIAWETAAIVVIAGTIFFPIMAGMDKITDRMNPSAPHTLDGMAYMDNSIYSAENMVLDLSQDYRAIQWMQRSVPGSPVIVEANIPEYRWGTRYTIYTGLPGVVGWNWHQRQQRAVTPSEWVTGRVDAITQFYNSSSPQLAENFLKRYDVSYIIVGQLERATYAPEGLEKFDEYNGSLWREVYRDGDTVIYQVNRN